MEHSLSDVAALDAAFREHFAELCAVSYRYLKSRAAAEDVVHDVFVQLWANPKRLRRRTALRAYLHAAVRNRAVSVLRRQIVERRWRARVEAAVAIAPEHAVNAAEQQLATGELTRVMNEVLAELPERCRQAAMLRWERQLSVAEIGTVMGIAVKTVEVHLTRAYGALRVRWARELRVTVAE